MTNPFATDAPAPLSGHQIHLSLGEQEVTIADVGAKVRRYAVGGRDVFTPFPAEVPAPAGHGAVLAPWPNRLRDGQYSWDGAEYQVAVSEPERGTALHGLALWERWDVEAPEGATAGPDGYHAGDAVTLRLRLGPSGGYPFDLLLEVTYRLTAAGLHVQATATNLGEHDAPYGVGFHPWLSPGDGGLDACTLRVDAATRVTVDERLLPVGTEPVSGAFDLRTPRSAAEVDLDDAFVDVTRDEDGLSWILLTGSDGRTAAVWMDESMDTWQVCTGDHLSAVDWRRTGVAAEPMSCLADAFRTGDRLVRLAPGQSHEVTWGAALL